MARGSRHGDCRQEEPPNASAPSLASPRSSRRGRAFVVEHLRRRPLPFLEGVHLPAERGSAVSRRPRGQFLSGAAQESNLPTDGLRRLTGFEDREEDAQLQGFSARCARGCASTQLATHERLRERAPPRVASEKVFGLELSPSTDESDLLLTILGSRQPVATHGNRFGLFPRFRRPTDLPLLAAGCACWAP
jgi:hypothetical protein